MILDCGWNGLITGPGPRRENKLRGVLWQENCQRESFWGITTFNRCHLVEQVVIQIRVLSFLQMLPQTLSLDIFTTSQLYLTWGGVGGRETILCDILIFSRGENRLDGTIGFVRYNKLNFATDLQIRKCMLQEQEGTHIWIELVVCFLVGLLKRAMFVSNKSQGLMLENNFH